MTFVDTAGERVNVARGSGEILTPTLVDVPDHESLWLTESLTLEAFGPG